MIGIITIIFGICTILIHIGYNIYAIYGSIQTVIFVSFVLVIFGLWLYTYNKGVIGVIIVVATLLILTMFFIAGLLIAGNISAFFWVLGFASIFWGIVLNAILGK